MFSFFPEVNQVILVMEYYNLHAMLGLLEVEEEMNRPPRRPRNPPVINRRMDPTLALSDAEFKSHFRSYIYHDSVLLFLLNFLAAISFFS